MLIEPTFIGFAYGKIYVANSGGNNIIIYFKNGKFYEKKDPKVKGTLKGTPIIFKKPVSMAFSRKYIYVSDYELSKILVFNRQFNYVGTIGTKGEDGSKLYHPVGIVYKNGYLYVANYGRSILTVFKLSKGFNVIKSYNFGTPGVGGRNFNHESNISISKNGKYLAVADTNNNRIVLYRIFGANK
jgi:DNA-binding beta-propeller fold protein YncE